MPRREEQSSYSEKIIKLFDEIVFGDGDSEDKKLKKLFGYCDKAGGAEDEARAVEELLGRILSGGA